MDLLAGLLLTAVDQWLKQTLPTAVITTDIPLLNPWVIALVLILFVLVLIITSYHHLPGSALTLVGAGLLSNIIDIVRVKGVIDYIPFWHYTTNLADVLIIAGILLLIKELLSR